VIDFIVVWVFPLVGMALLEMELIGMDKNDLEKMKLRFILLTVFLVIVHVAMSSEWWIRGLSPKPPAAK